MTKGILTSIANAGFSGLTSGAHTAPIFGGSSGVGAHGPGF